MPDIRITPDPDAPAIRATVTRPGGALLGVVNLRDGTLYPAGVRYTAAELAALARLVGGEAVNRG